MFKVSALRKRQALGGIIGIILGASLFYIFTLDVAEDYVSIGPMNTGHQTLNCYACHADASGNLLQQVQSNLSHAVGVRANSVDFGTQDVTLKNCYECHDRPNDRHPTHRFKEPRFKDAVKQIDATTCITCHSEHHGARVTLARVNYCINCHQDLTVENDPLDVSHKTIIQRKAWYTCIQCHDFHGNHKYNVPEKMSDTIPMQTIQAYLKGGEDPYGNNKKYTALSQEEWLKTLEN